MQAEGQVTNKWWYGWTWSGSLGVDRGRGKTFSRNDFSVCDVGICVLRKQIDGFMHTEWGGLKWSPSRPMSASYMGTCWVSLGTWANRRSTEQAGNSGLWFSCHGGYGKFITTPKDLKSWRTNYVLGPRLGKALSNVLIPTWLTHISIPQHLHTPRLLTCARNCRKPPPLSTFLQSPQLKSLTLCSLWRRNT